MGQSISTQRKDKKSKKGQPSPPPPYVESVTTKSSVAKPIEKPTTRTAIQATDVPQWKWTNSECRQWLTEVLVYYCEMEREKAEGLAEKSMAGSFGPRIYALKKNSWKTFLGPSIGTTVYNYIFGMMYQEGAMPSGFHFPHQLPKNGMVEPKDFIGTF